MPMLRPIDRQLLGDAGVALDDDAYARTVAGMGLFLAHRVTGMGSGEPLLGWSAGNFRIELERLTREPEGLVLSNARERWLAEIDASGSKRVLVEGAGVEPDLVSVVRILGHPAVQARSVFIGRRQPEADPRWQWPLRVAAFQADLEHLELLRLTTLWPAKTLAEVNALSREQGRCEILVMSGNLREGLARILALPYRIRACHVALIGPVDVAWRALDSYLATLAAETQAAALSLVACPPAEVPKRLNDLITNLSHNTVYDLALGGAFPLESSLHVVDERLFKAAALTTAARELGRSVRELPQTATLSVPDYALQRARLRWTTANPPAELAEELDSGAEALPFDAESQGATALTEISTAERGARRTATATEPARFLQGDLFKFTEGGPVPEGIGFVVGVRYRLDIFIAPPGEGAITAEQAFDDTQLDWRRKHAFTLQVMFADLEQWEEPLTGTLVLPRVGASSRCPFLFSPTRPGPLAGRVTVYHRGRILNTALLRATVFDSEDELAGALGLEPLRFAVESEVRRSLGTLDERRRFDVCMVVNRTSDNVPAATTGAKDGAFIASLDTVGPQLAAINGLMNDVANDARRYGKGLMSTENAELLCNLALEGNWIYRNLVLNYLYKSSAAQALRTAEHLQIVSTRPDEPVPLEFVYDYPPPQEGAPVCKNAREALRTGRCPSGCKPKTSPAPHVCPLGFWGLSRVIERHEIDPQGQNATLSGAAVVKSEPVTGRNRLPLQGPSLVAASKQVPAASRRALERTLVSVWGAEVVPVKDWGQWVSAVQKKRPVMLLALPHAGGSGAHISLEISGTVMKSAYIDASYVKADPETNGPLVVLLGCDTSNVADTESYTRHVTVFRQADAALVLGTVATVLGSDAAKVAGQLVKQLATTSNNSTECFGEVLRQVKREAVANSQMLALCLVAFGDADWRLG